MEVQSLSVCVPAGCPNKCKFCVSRMHSSNFKDQLEDNLPFYDLYSKDFCRRLQFARDNGCNTAILTGNGEPLMNTDFLKSFANWNDSIQSPFRWIEIQTSGVGLDDEKLRFLRNTVGVSSISLSLSDMFDDDSNQEMNGTPDKLKVNIVKLCHEIKRYDFNLRLSLNMTNRYERRFKDTHKAMVILPNSSSDQTSKRMAMKFIQYANCFERMMERANIDLRADMVTFRQLYVSGDPDLEQNKWIAENQADEDLLLTIKQTIRERGRVLEMLPFGAVRYSYRGLSCVVDEECMEPDAKPVARYLILRPNCKIFTRWDDDGSLLF